VALFIYKAYCMEYSGMVIECEGHAAQLTIGKGDGNTEVRVIELDY
jgi:hypothetical protein